MYRAACIRCALFFRQERAAVLGSLAERARMISEEFNAIEGVRCNTVQGAMYAFPRLLLPAKAIAKAKVRTYCTSEPVRRALIK